MLGVILRDQFPEIKVQASQLISELSKAMKEEIGKYAKQIIESLCLNMKHQHNKIRKISISLNKSPSKSVNIRFIKCDEK